MSEENVDPLRADHRVAYVVITVRNPCAARMETRLGRRRFAGQTIRHLEGDPITIRPLCSGASRGSRDEVDYARGKGANLAELTAAERHVLLDAARSAG